MSEYRTFWIVLLALALLSPLGLYLPELLKAGGAWGEWGVEEVNHMVGYAPQGMRKLADLWKAPVQDYALPGQEGGPVAFRGLSYILSAISGIGLSGGAAFLLTRWLTKKRS